MEHQINETIDNSVNNYPGTEKVPNDTITLVMGIVSIVLLLCSCCCSYIAFIPAITSIIGFVMGSSGKKAYDADPGRYSHKSYQNLNIGRIMSLVCMILSILWVVVVIVIFILYGAAAISNPEYFLNSY